MDIVLISGKQGSGKTTLQKALISYYEVEGKKAVAVNYASVIYEIHDFAIALLEKYGIKRDIKKDGRLLQLLGTEWGRETIDYNIWVTCTQNLVWEIERTLNPDLVVIADCRFPNEIAAFPDALTVRLVCDEELRKKRCSNWRVDTSHPSETSLDLFEKRLKFDLYFNTETRDVDSSVKKIIQKLKEMDAERA